MHPSKPRLPEILLLAALLALILLFAIIQPPPFDYMNYIRASRGDVSGYYYAYWFIPIFGLLDRLGYPAGYILWQVINLLCAWWAVRVFGGKPGLALASFQMITILWCGQIAGVILGGLALLQWGLSRRRWDLAGLGLLVAATKPQTGLFTGLFLLLTADLAWRERLRSLALPAAVGLLSLVVYPAWPLGVIHTQLSHPAMDWGSVSLWKWIGPWALLLWLPLLAFARQMTRQQRLVAFCACAPLALPYYQQADLIVLFALPIGRLPLLGNLGWGYLLAGVLGMRLPQLLAVVPGAAYLGLILPAAHRWSKALIWWPYRAIGRPIRQLYKVD